MADESSFIWAVIDQIVSPQGHKRVPCLMRCKSSSLELKVSVLKVEAVRYQAEEGRDDAACHAQIARGCPFVDAVRWQLEQGTFSF